MSYKHIVVALDLGDHSEYLANRAAKLAKALDAELSFIHIDVNYSEVYTGLIEVNLVDSQSATTKLSTQKLQDLSEKLDYPVSNTLVGRGDLVEELSDAIKERGFDLVVCGHHHDFWGKLLSNTRHMIHDMPIDLLVVPLQD
ncbi:universal stress protein [Vibrio breoganii]|uniref:Universal stress protein n=1 Tax=Vibrio breoganii TaxID=553239 RepID=A0AAP8MXS3_9VIBR|nr:universal stress protein [Vibrio breoganii]ANO31764.1 universal stress global response regulator UspA [Vibrio breoganii]MDN3714492.1 universal stress protein [Vibrio breoganii]OED98796.1 universal stress global response regulator UspA [Vibrio breoganii ZF-55]OED99287.1 universal stress global response regulator UspA [Vibrio breoganii ZF-29]PMG05423.1 universal stress global response regulator UspA [Vibrio breoganii]